MKQVNGIGSSAVMEVHLTSTSRDGSVSKTHLIVTKTSVSGESTQLSTTFGLVRQNAGAEDVRYEKVAPIKASIEAGTYNVPASAVADKLIGSMFG